MVKSTCHTIVLSIWHITVPVKHICDPLAQNEAQVISGWIWGLLEISFCTVFWWNWCKNNCPTPKTYHISYHLHIIWPSWCPCHLIVPSICHIVDHHVKHMPHNCTKHMPHHCAKHIPGSRALHVHIHVGEKRGSRLPFSATSFINGSQVRCLVINQR